MGMEAYVYGYPLVVMDVTREVMTATPAPTMDGTAAPINQLAKMPYYVSPYFTNVVRISLNSLWTTAFLDLDKEPIILSISDMKGRYYVFSVINMCTDVFASVGKRTTGTAPRNFLIAGPNWSATAPNVAGRHQDRQREWMDSTAWSWSVRYRLQHARRHRYGRTGADLQEDTIYPIAFIDGDGNRLNAANKYVMHYDNDRFPPTNASWSVSLYQGPNYVPNALDRYDIAPGVLPEKPCELP